MFECFRMLMLTDLTVTGVFEMECRVGRYCAATGGSLLVIGSAAGATGGKTFFLALHLQAGKEAGQKFMHSPDLFPYSCLVLGLFAGIDRSAAGS